MGPANQDWEVVSLDDLDSFGLQLVSDFFNEQFPGIFYPECTPEIFKWKLGPSNPAGSGFLTVAVCDGRVVGTASGTRKNLVENSNPFQAIEIGDTFTHPDFRKRGRCITPLLSMEMKDEYFHLSVFGRLVSETIQRAQLQGIEYIYGTPNENSRPPYLGRLEFRDIDKGKILSKVIFTSKTAKLQRIRWILILHEYFAQSFAWLLRYILFGTNSLHELTKRDMLEFSISTLIGESHQPDKVYLENNFRFLLHRYVNHPNYMYRYFQIVVKDEIKGTLITTEVIRVSGVSSFLVSDWIVLDKKIEKRISLFISKLRSYNVGSETISFWDCGKSIKMTELFLGIFKRRNISVISKDFRKSNLNGASEFGDFHMGWSDNG